MVPWPEIITTGRSGCSRLMVSSTSMPSSLEPCSQMSSTTSCGRRERIAASADSESPATRVEYPSSCSMPEIRSRMSSSSSTMRISDAISNPFLLIFTSSFCPFRVLLGEGEGQGDLCPLPVLHIGERDFPAMVFHDLAHDRQAQPRALGAGGDVRLGQAMAMFRRQADAIVGDAEGKGRILELDRNVDLSGFIVALGDAGRDPLARIL